MEQPCNPYLGILQRNQSQPSEQQSSASPDVTHLLDQWADLGETCPHNGLLQRRGRSALALKLEDAGDVNKRVENAASFLDSETMECDDGSAADQEVASAPCDSSTSESSRLCNSFELAMGQVQESGDHFTGMRGRRRTAPDSDAWHRIGQRRMAPDFDGMAHQLTPEGSSQVAV